MKFLEIFNEIEKGNYALTDEAIYSSFSEDIDMIPIYGGNQDHRKVERKISIKAKTKKNQPITVFDGEGIIISLDGSAGCMTYKSGEKFALNHHAGFITVRKEHQKEVNLEYFALFFQNHYKDLAVSDGSKTLSLQQIYSEDIDLPDIELQNEIINALKKSFSTISGLASLKAKVLDYLSKTVVCPEEQYTEKNVPLKSVVRIIQGHQITDEEIYTHEGNIPIYTGGNDVKGYWNKSIINLKDLPCITYATKAFDGVVSIQNSIFDANNTAVLIMKNEYKDKVKLAWLQTVLPQLLLQNTTSNDGVSYLNKDIVLEICIDIPKGKIQDRCIERYYYLSSLKERIERIEEKYSLLLQKEVVWKV